MKKIYIITLLIIIAGGVFFFLFKNQAKKQTPTASNISQPEIINNNSNSQNQSSSNQEQKNIHSETTSDFQPPFPKSRERINKKPFGIFITTQNSPVQPERFHGYHTGSDFEIFPEELNLNVPVSAVCSGKLALKKYASGYGGVVVQNCSLNGNPITVIYGHLKLASIAANTGDELKIGDTIGILGAEKSVETNGERKHLHLGFHKGSAISLLGYVQNKADLSAWIDPCLYICHNLD
jgi:hypothetical protein